ncbi:mitochondrial carrier, partial [Gloeophyllum trabeum ATCC 11539]
NKTAVCALTASYISTFVGYPLDSLKSRLQTRRVRISVPKLAAQVYRDEGLIGFYRGFWIPLMTISFVRASDATSLGATSMTIYDNTKVTLHRNGMLARNTLVDVAASGGIGGALAGSAISFASAPFELVKIRRQLEYAIAASKGQRIAKPPSTMEAVRDIIRTNGRFGMWTGMRMHFLRDTSGTGLYFLEYDGMRYLMGRRPNGEQGPPPPWLPLPNGLIPFVCGSFCGVTSWALIYPLDVVKTKVQERSLAGLPPRGVRETFRRLIRGPDPNNPQPIHVGVARIYRGLGVSATRSITTHGLLWTFFDIVAGYIDRLP